MRLRDVGLRAQILSGTRGPTMNMLGNLNFAIVAVARGWLALHHVVTVGAIVSFLNYTRQFNQPVNQLANQYHMVQSAVAGAERVFEMLDAASEYGEGAGGRDPGRLAGHVALQDVSFGYSAGVDVLRGVSLEARPGQTIALVGPTDPTRAGGRGAGRPGPRGWAEAAHR